MLHPTTAVPPGSPAAAEGPLPPPGALEARSRLARVQAQAAASPRTIYLTVLSWAFTAFSTVRVLAYLPTLWAIHASGDSSQHSLWTWFTWLGANLTMAAWLYENNGQRANRAVIVNTGNACMCLVSVAMIVAYRL